MLRVKQHLVPDSKLHVPLVGVTSSLASVLLLLDQRTRPHRDEHHQLNSCLASAGGTEESGAPGGERGRRGC